MSNEFPCNFKSLANVGDVIRAELADPSVNGDSSPIVAKVFEKTDSGYRAKIIEATICGRPDGTLIGATVGIPYGILSDWPTRVTVVERAETPAVDHKALEAAFETIRTAVDREGRVAKIIATQRDEALRKLNESERLVSQLQARLVTSAAVIDSMQRDITKLSKKADDLADSWGRAESRIRSMRDQRDEAIARAEKAEADYRDLRRRVLMAPPEARESID